MDSDLRNVNHIKRKWISFISNEKGFNLPLGHPILQENYENNIVEWKYVVLITGKALKLEYREMSRYYSFFFFFFPQILFQAFYCISLSALLSVLATSCPESPSDLPVLFYGVPQHLSSLLPLQNPFHAALLAFANCCWCLIRQHFYEKYHLSAAVPLQGHFTKEMFFYVHTVNG